MARAGKPDPALAAALKGLRETHAATQETTAFHAKIAVSTLQAIEGARSEPAWGTVRAIIAALGVSLAELAAAIEDAEAH